MRSLARISVLMLPISRFQFDVSLTLKSRKKCEEQKRWPPNTIENCSTVKITMRPITASLLKERVANINIIGQKYQKLAENYEVYVNY